MYLKFLTVVFSGYKTARFSRNYAVRTKRFECVEISSGRTYLFNPNAEVELLPVKQEI